MCSLRKDQILGVFVALSIPLGFNGPAPQVPVFEHRSPAGGAVVRDGGGASGRRQG